MPAGSSLGEARLEAREGGEEARRGLLALGVERAADRELEPVVAGAQRGRDARGSSRARSAALSGRERPATAGDQLRRSPSRRDQASANGAPEARRGPRSRSDRRRAAPGPRPRRSRSRSPRERRPRCRSQEAVELRGRDPAAVDAELDPLVLGRLGRRRPRARCAYSLAPSRVVDLEQVDPLGAGPLPASTATAASPPNHGRDVGVEVEPACRSGSGSGPRRGSRAAPPNTGSRSASSLAAAYSSVSGSRLACR